MRIASNASLTVSGVISGASLASAGCSGKMITGVAVSAAVIVRSIKLRLVASKVEGDDVCVPLLGE